MSELERKVEEQDTDPFRLGTRYLKEVGPDGEVSYRMVPLREEDLLFPQEEDRPVENVFHRRILAYLHGVLEILLAKRPDAIVFSNHRIDFGVDGMEPLGPDVVVFVESNREWEGPSGTFEVIEYAARPLLVVEVTSPGTRSNDLSSKVGFYFEAGVPFYAVVDTGPKGNWSRVVLRGYRATPEGYSPVEPDEKGRLWLSPLNQWLVPNGKLVSLCGIDGQRLPEWRETDAANKKATVRIEELETLTEEAILARQEAERARIQELRNRADAETREADEVQKRLDAEQRESDEVRKRADAERVAADEVRKRADAERVATNEARKRADAEQTAADEVCKRADAESRAADLAALVAQLQAQLRQTGGS